MGKDIKIDSSIEKAFKSYAGDFGPRFTHKVMAKIENLNTTLDASGIYDMFFKRVMLSGAVAIAAMLIMAFIMNGSLSVDALLGLSDLGMENALALSIYE